MNFSLRRDPAADVDRPDQEYDRPDAQMPTAQARIFRSAT